MKTLSKIIERITPKQLHDWYLEATKELNPENYNPNAQKSYEDLADEQKFIDKYIADKISQSLIQILEHIVEEGYKKLKLGEGGNINDDSLSKFDIGFNEGIESIIFTIKSELKKINDKKQDKTKNS